MAPNSAMGLASPISECIRTKRAWRENAAMVERMGERVARAKNLGVNVDEDEGTMPIESENNIKFDWYELCNWQ